MPVAKLGRVRCSGGWKELCISCEWVFHEHVLAPGLPHPQEELGILVRQLRLSAPSARFPMAGDPPWPDLTSAFPCT